MSNSDLASTLLPALWPDNKVYLIDVGGAGGIQQKWLRYSNSIVPVLFEPNPEEAQKLRSTLKLANLKGTQKLNIAKYWGCTSLREPNFDVLSKYRIAPAFATVARETVDCIRYDTLFAQGRVPQPDAIKIDVQGYEYEVLLGFGGLLQDCLAIEVETHFYQIYKEQKLLHDLISLLGDFGFALRHVRPVPNFDGDVVELDAWFTKDITQWRGLESSKKERFAMICDAWNLIDYGRVKSGQAHNHLDPV
jgi:FkbM family methyltransferase